MKKSLNDDSKELIDHSRIATNEQHIKLHLKKRDKNIDGMKEEN